MVQFLFGVVCLLITVICRALYKTYRHLPQKELKRLARHGDQVATLLYKPAAYGLSLQLLLGGIGGVSGVIGFVLLVQILNIWLALLVVLVVAVLFSMAIVPSADVTKFGLLLATKLAPAIAWLLERAQPLFGWFARVLRRLRPLRIHTGLYEKSDLVELLESQKHQPDNRIPLGEVDLLTHALQFGDRYVTDALIPKRVVKLVSINDAAGPVLMGELHKSGHSRFPVYDGTRDHIVGLLYLHDLVGNKKAGKVSDIMNPKLTYVHEDFTLYQTLQAFIKTKQQLFIVVNGFEEFVGIITIEDVLEQMIGLNIVDEFDRYDDLRAVAAAAAKTEHHAHKKAKQEPEATTEPTEVVE